MATEIRPTTTARLAAEALGTFILVFGGVGTAVLAGSHVGFHGIALAFGLTVVVGAYAFGPVSGGHFNPAVTIGLAAAGRFAWKDVPAYVVAQVLGGGVASSLLFFIATGRDGAELGNFASNGFQLYFLLNSVNTCLELSVNLTINVAIDPAEEEASYGRDFADIIACGCPFF